MIKNIFLFLLSLASLSAFSQVVYTEPGLPGDDQLLTLYFNAAEGSGGLKDFSGDIYAHTGVITNRSTGASDWKYVKAGWSENIEACKLTRVSQNLYSLSIDPNIRSFYGVPSSETILKMAFVFRSADGSQEGKGDGNSDIFVDVSSGGFALVLSSPESKLTAVDPGAEMTFRAYTSETAIITLSINGSTVFGANGTELLYPYVFRNPGSYTIVVKAKKEDEVLKDSVVVLVASEPEIIPVPEGMEDGINYTSDTSVTLVLYAPDKQNVYVTGDFNNWSPSSEYQLKKDGDRWWVALNGLQADKAYAYQYLIDGSLKLADPYAELVLDPWNDSYISDEVFPNMPAYPVGHTNGLVSVFEIKSVEYEWENTSFIAPSKEELVIYELHIRDFVEGHTYHEVLEKLDYLQSLGINAIELMPFNEFEGNSSWGYNPSFYFAPDKYYGTPEDLKGFIDECHGRGMAVIMDMVLNHSFSQSPLVQMYLEANGKVSENNPWYNVDSPNDVYYWGYDFDHEAAATKYFVDRVLKYWLQEYNLDGYRLDFTKGFTNTPGDGWAYDADRISILTRLYFVMQSAKPGSYMICEHLADNKEEKELSALGILLWGNMNYSYNEATMGYYTKSDLSGTSYKSRGWSQPNLISYMESHDEERLMYKNLQYGDVNGSYNIKDLETAIERNKLASTFFFSIPGPKMIWQFGELGYDYSIDHNGRVGEKPIRWDYNEDETRIGLRDHYSKMISLKTQNDVFNTSDFTLKVGGIANKQITLRSDDENVVVIGNFGMSASSMSVDFESVGWWFEHFTGDSILLNNATQTITLEAGEYRLYASSKLLGINTSLQDQKSTDVLVYPNPAVNAIKVLTDLQLKSYQIFDLQGRIIMQGILREESPSISVHSLKKGSYIIQLANERQWVNRIFVKR